MSPEARIALENSIKKWEGIVAGIHHDNGWRDCPLCQLFQVKADCQGCPVMQETGEPFCRGTPYRDYSAYPSSEAAQRELDFLRSLLPTIADPLKPGASS